MKRILLIFFLFGFYNSLAQKSYTPAVYKDEKYKYVYLIQFGEENDANSYEYHRVKDALKSEFQLLLKDGKPVIGAFIQIKKSGNDSLLNSAYTDSSGYAAFHLRPGSYNASIFADNLKDLSFNFDIPEGKQIKFIADMGFVYNDLFRIGSKKRLKDKEIEKITACIEANIYEVALKCSIKKKYVVTRSSDPPGN